MPLDSSQLINITTAIAGLEATAIIWVVNRNESTRREFDQKLKDVYSSVERAQLECTSKVKEAINDREGMKKDLEAKIDRIQADEKLARSELQNSIDRSIGKIESAHNNAFEKMESTVLRLSEKLEALPEIKAHLDAVTRQLDRLLSKPNGAD